MKGHICACEYFINTNIVDQIIKIKNNAMKTNADFFFMAKRNFISDKFHCGYHG